MRSKWVKVVLAAAVAMLFIQVSGLAQQDSSDDSRRKVKTKVTPSYPELARRMNVTGKVKIEVIIAPDGHVRSAKAIGGHPLLVQSCLDAMKDWKFAPGPEESTQIFEFSFQGANGSGK